MKKKRFTGIFRKIAGVAAALAMSAMLVPGGSLTAAAAENNEILDPDQAGSITVTLTNRETGALVTGGKLALYKVADVKVDNGFVYTWRDVFRDAGEVPAEDEDLTADLANKLWELAQYSGRSLDEASVEVGSDGTAVFQDLEVGLYLVVQTEKADGNLVIDPFLVTVPVRNADGSLTYNVDASPKVGKVTDTTPVPSNNNTSTTTSSSSSSSSSSSTTKLPQTGQLWWPVMLLGCAGAVLIMAGWARKRRS